MKTLIACLLSLSIILLADPAHALNLSEQAPDFSLTSHQGKNVSLRDYRGKIVVLEWFNAGCPFVQKHYRNGDMQKLQSEYTAKGVVWLTVNSTNPRHRDFLDSSALAKFAQEHKVTSSLFLSDPTGSVGKSYGAKSTPHMFVIDKEGRLAYDGAIDDSPDTSSDPKVATNYVRLALDSLLTSKPITTAQTEAYGCSVKYAG